MSIATEITNPLVTLELTIKVTGPGQAVRDIRRKVGKVQGASVIKGIYLTMETRSIDIRLRAVHRNTEGANALLTEARTAVYSIIQEHV